VIVTLSFAILHILPAEGIAELVKFVRAIQTTFPAGEPGVASFPAGGKPYYYYITRYRCRQ
jgi:hypothetical protein